MANANITTLITALQNNSQFDQTLKETNASSNIIELLKYINNNPNNTSYEALLNQIFNLNIIPSEIGRFLHVRDKFITHFINSYQIDKPKVITNKFINNTVVVNDLKTIVTLHWNNYNAFFKFNNNLQGKLVDNFNKFSTTNITPKQQTEILIQSFIIISLYYILISELSFNDPNNPGNNINQAIVAILDSDYINKEKVLYYYQSKFKKLIFDIENLYLITTSYVYGNDTYKFLIQHTNLENLSMLDDSYLYKTLQLLVLNIDAEIKKIMDTGNYLSSYFNVINTLFVSLENVML